MFYCQKFSYYFHLQHLCITQILLYLIIYILHNGHRAGWLKCLLSDYETWVWISLWQICQLTSWCYWSGEEISACSIFRKYLKTITMVNQRCVWKWVDGTVQKLSMVMLAQSPKSSWQSLSMLALFKHADHARLHAFSQEL